MKADFVPSTEAEFYPWQGTLLNYISAHAGAWGITEAEWTLLSGLQADYQAKYAIATNPATRTAATVLAKNKAHKAFVKAIRLVLKVHITYNPAVSDDDRKNMDLPVHKTTHTPAPVALTYPETHIDSGTICRLIIHFYDEGKEKTRAKPPGQHGAEIRWMILPAPPTSHDDLVRSSFDTRTPFTLEFDENERGKMVYFCLRWENTRGQKGPWSKIQNAIIP